MSKQPFKPACLIGLAARVALTLAGAAGLPVNEAISAPSLKEQLGQCAAEVDNALRLACYDRIGASLKPARAAPTAAAPPTSAAPRAAAPPSAAAPLAAPDTPDSPGAPQAPGRSASASATAGERPGGASGAASSADFGVSNGPLQAKQQATKQKSMTAAVSTISTRSGGELAVTLDNGQVWIQNKPLPYFPLKAGDKVEIDVGAMGAYIMWVPSIRRATKVTRVY